MAKGLSPTQRTLRALRQEGRLCAITEKWNAHAGPFGIRQDLFGFIDVLALDRQRGFVGVQCCAGSGHAARRTKILNDCHNEALEWLHCGGKIEIWSWRKLRLKRGGAAMRWAPRIDELTLYDFGEVSDTQDEGEDDDEGDEING